MCGRYTIYQTDQLADRYKIDKKRQDELLKQIKSRYNAAPAQALPVVVKGELENRIDLMRWGFIPAWAKDDKVGYKLINARSESVFEKPMWKRPILRQRCLVPSNGFYEWKPTDEGKQPFYIHPTDQELFSYAGVFDHWTDKQTGEVIESFSILTTSANHDMKAIHDRMPIILKPNEEDRWLEPSNDTPDSIADLLRPYDDGKLEIFPVTKEVNSIKNDNENLIHVMPE